jgi:hypothetical protein
MTSVYASFKQLIMSQYAAIAVLVIGMFSSQHIWSVIGIGIVLALLLLLVTRLGVVWFVSAIRVGTYLFYEYELPEWRAKSGEQDFKARDLWLLANRSESFMYYKANNDQSIKLSFIDRYAIGYGLNTFLNMQQFLTLFAFGMFGLKALQIKGSISSLPNPTILLISGIIIVALMIATIALAQNTKRSDIPSRMMKRWKNYTENRKLRDHEYLEHMGLDKG